MAKFDSGRAPKTLAFVGPLPPPLNGFSNVTEKMLGLLREQAAVEVFNRTWKADGRGLLTQLLQVAKFAGACCRGTRFTLYVALSGGWGQIFDSLYIIIARVFRQRIFIHHHSFAYAHSSNVVNRLVHVLVKRQAHIVLSHGMGAALVQRYQLQPDKLIVVSNAAFFAEAAAGDCKSVLSDPKSPLRIGFLSNITFEKGFVEFFAVLDGLRRIGVQFQAVIAGPVDAAATERFDNLRATAPEVTYLGAVYGKDKEQFYRDLDVFLFPTYYKNEAEPLVIHESLRSGVYVIANDRGAIAEILSHGAGLVTQRENFVSAAVGCIQTLNVDRNQLRQRQRSASEQALKLREAGRVSLERVLHLIASKS
jgi:glycosyltransferase involved in cell wall biosynthesis